MCTVAEPINIFDSEERIFSFAFSQASGQSRKYTVSSLDSSVSEQNSSPFLVFLTIISVIRPQTTALFPTLLSTCNLSGSRYCEIICWRSLLRIILLKFKFPNPDSFFCITVQYQLYFLSSLSTICSLGLIPRIL